MSSVKREAVSQHRDPVAQRVREVGQLDLQIGNIIAKTKIILLSTYLYYESNLVTVQSIYALSSLS